MRGSRHIEQIRKAFTVLGNPSRVFVERKLSAFKVFSKDVSDEFVLVSVLRVWPIMLRCLCLSALAVVLFIEHLLLLNRKLKTKQMKVIYTMYRKCCLHSYGLLRCDAGSYFVTQCLALGHGSWFCLQVLSRLFHLWDHHLGLPCHFVGWSAFWRWQFSRRVRPDDGGHLPSLHLSHVCCLLSVPILQPLGLFAYEDSYCSPYSVSSYWMNLRFL